MKKSFKNALIYVIFIGIIIFAGAMLLDTTSDKDKTDYSDIKQYFYDEKVKSFVVDDHNVLEMVIRDASGGKDGTKTVKYKLRSLDLFYSDLKDTITEQHQEGILESYDYPAPKQIPVWVSFIPYVLIIVVIIALWVFFMHQATGGKGGSKMGSVGKAKAKLVNPDKTKVFFKDVAGADEEKAELEEIVEFLRDPAYFTKLGAKIPHGVLLMGPPGTGKTLLAKAVAGEAGVPFYSISGSDFVEMYVGVGASRVRDLFDTARKNPAAIIFIDEIDAVGRHRGAGLGGGHDEREQTLNQLLVEMDGFGTNEGVIVIAATNRPDILDPALLRPGRFDRQITVNYPDLKGREEILHVHAKNKPFEDDVDLTKIAQTTVGFTGADLANLLNEAALLAARKGKSLIGMNDIEEASTKIIVGMPKKNHKIRPEEKKKTAYHEAGHAIIAHVLPSLDPVRQISIIPSGRALGYTLTPPTEDKYSVYKNGLKDEICELLGGRVAEKIIFDDISGGASNDIERATAIAKNMVMKLGMSDELGPILYGSQHSNDEVFLGRDFNNSKNYSEETAAKIDLEIKKIILEAYDRTEKLLRANIDKLHFIAEFLVRNEVMEQAQFERAMNSDATMEELEEMVAEKRRRSEEENRLRAERIKAEEAKREAERAEEEAKKEKLRRDMPSQSISFADYLNNIEREKAEAEKRKNSESEPSEEQKDEDDTDEH